MADGFGRARILPAAPSFNSRYRPSRSLDLISRDRWRRKRPSVRMGCAITSAALVDPLFDGFRLRGSHAARRYVAIDLSANADENDSMSGRVSFIPFDLVIRDDDLFSRLPVGTAERAI